MNLIHYISSAHPEFKMHGILDLQIHHGIILYYCAHVQYCQSFNHLVIEPFNHSRFIYTYIITIISTVLFHYIPYIMSTRYLAFGLSCKLFKYHVNQSYIILLWLCASLHVILTSHSQSCVKYIGFSFIFVQVHSILGSPLFEF